jgi:hypothetical protein
VTVAYHQEEVRVKVAIAVIVALSLVSAPVPSATQERGDLEKGIRQVEGGEFEDAVITLDAAARQLAAEGKRPKDLARAYTYLAIAYLELSQEQAAKAKFLEALQADKDLRLDPKQLPPKVIQFFQDAAREAKATLTTDPAPSPRPSPTTTSSAAPTTTTAATKGKSKTVPIVIGVGAAAAGIAVAAAAGGGKGPTPTPVTTLPAGTTLGQLSASVTSPQRSTNLVCTQNVNAVVTLTNRGTTAVTVTGVRSEIRVVSGGCSAAPPFTFSPGATLVGANQTVTVLNNTLFNGGAGCCSAGSVCNGTFFCEFTSVLTVITGLGEVPAGGFNYGVTYNRCVACASSVGAASSCPGPAPQD